MSGHLLSHSNSFGFEMEKDAAGCRALNRNFIVGGEQTLIEQISLLSSFLGALNEVFEQFRQTTVNCHYIILCHIPSN